MARGKHRPDVVTWGDFNSGDGFPSFPGQRYLAEGDSWFSMSGLPAYNLLFELRFRKATQIVNCAFPGDTIVRMSALSRNRHFREAITTPGLKWKAVFLSGGGNDLIDEAGDILIAKRNRKAASKKPAGYCDQSQLQALIAEVQSGFRRLAGLRDGHGSNAWKVPMITHTYDYATPRDAPARFFLFGVGPWLHPAMEAAEIPAGDRIAVADYLIDRMAEGTLALQKGHDRIRNFHVLDSRGTLTRARAKDTGSSKDWQNEIHPNDDGYKKLAKLVEQKLRELGV